MEQNSYKIVYKQGEGEIVEKKSRFIAHVHPITEESQALELIEKYQDPDLDETDEPFDPEIDIEEELSKIS